MLSLGLLMGAPHEQIDVILKFAGKPGRDALFDGLAASVDNTRRASRKLLHPKPFELLNHALIADDASDGGEYIVEFLQKYYAGLKGVYFHNTHLKDDAGFAGYWSFETAAVVILRDIDDSGFRDNIYYPAELADYARRRARKVRSTARRPR